MQTPNMLEPREISLNCLTQVTFGYRYSTAAQPIKLRFTSVQWRSAAPVTLSLDFSPGTSQQAGGTVPFPAPDLGPPFRPGRCVVIATDAGLAGNHGAIDVIDCPPGGQGRPERTDGSSSGAAVVPASRHPEHGTPDLDGNPSSRETGMAFEPYVCIYTRLAFFYCVVEYLNSA